MKMDSIQPIDNMINKDGTYSCDYYKRLDILENERVTISFNLNHITKEVQHLDLSKSACRTILQAMVDEMSEAQCKDLYDKIKSGWEPDKYAGFSLRLFKGILE